MYGIGKKPTDDYGRRCLLTRRLIEKGVRFVCPVSGGGPGNMQWDAHEDIEENHKRKAAETDQPMAALLKDLKRRGLLDTTLVMIGAGVRTVAGVARQQGPRSSQPRVHHADGRRRHSGRHHVRRDRRDRPEGDREAGPLPRHPHHDPAPAGSQSGCAELSAPGPAGTADADSGRSDQGHFGVTAGTAKKGHHP